MTAVSSTQSFPWTSLATITRAEVAALRGARLWVEEHVRLDVFAGALQEILGAEVNLLVRRVQPNAQGRAAEGHLGVLLSGAGDHDVSPPGALLETEPALAAAVVGRAIRRTPPFAVDGTRPSSSAVAGALAAVLFATARRAHAAVPLRVLAAGEAGALEEQLGRACASVTAITLTVLLANDAFEARLLVGRDAPFAVVEAPWTARHLATMGETPLSLPVVACATAATVAEVAAVRPGDVWLPGTWELSVTAATSGAELKGPVLLAAPSSATGLRAQLVERGRLVLSGDVVPLCAAETDMIESDAKNALVNAVGDVPVVVRVEVGEARMTAREWASLGRGDVVTLGRRVGSHVLLRVGGVPVARGELVSVDGEVGVRIAERVAGEPAGA